MKMKMEILADKTLGWFERMMESPWCERVVWTVIGFSAFYVGLMCLRVIIR